MKKFYALAACAMAMAIPAWADEPASSCTVTMTVSNAFDTTGTIKADKITADVSLADGIYTIENFLGTGQPLSFTLPEDPENLKYVYGGVGFPGDNLVDDGDGYFYLTNPADESDSLEFNLTNYNGADLTLYWPGIYPEYSSYYHRTEEGKKPWYITIDMDGCDTEGEWYYLDVTFWLPELVEPTQGVVVPETSGNSTAWIETPWSNGEYYGYYTDVTKNERGNYTTTNFMYSGASVTVTFDVDELKNSKDGYVGFTSLNGIADDYVDLLDADGDSATCYAYNVDGTMATIEYPYFFNWADYSYVELYSEEEAAEYGYNAYICLLIRGKNPEGKNSDYYEVWFDVNIDLTETGVQSLTIGGDAEYYNLQGVRVANPDKGLHIMRQGGKTVKVTK